MPEPGFGRARIADAAAWKSASSSARAWLPYVLVAPQLAITIVFFFWPAGAGALAVAAGRRTRSASTPSSSGSRTSATLFNDEHYLASFRVTAVFSRARRRASACRSRWCSPCSPTASIRGAHGLQDAADLALRGRAGGRRRAVAVPVQPDARHRRALAAAAAASHWNPLLDGDEAMILVVIAAVWKQISYNFLFFLAGLQSIPKSLIEAAAIDGAGPGQALRRRSSFRCCRRRRSSCSSSTSSTRSSTRSRSSTPRRGGGPAQATEILVYKVYNDGFKAARPRRLGRAVGDPDGDRDRADGRPVPLHRAEGAVLMPPTRLARWSRTAPLAAPFVHVATVDPDVARRRRAIVAFPLYVTFVASTLTAEQVLAAPMPLVPGRRSSSRTTRRCCRTAPANVGARRCGG